MYKRQELSFRRVKKRCCIWGFAIPAVTVAVGFAVNGVFPFGDHGVLIIDSLHQYLPFFTEFHEKLVNSESLLYSFGGGMGFNFWDTFAYYLASPMNFLVTLFPKANMMDAMALFIILKIGLCGLTMAYYLVHRNKGKNYYPIVFSAMFALSSFIIGYYFNLMWLDSIAMLPLIMMGIERIVKGKSGKLFCLSLFYGLDVYKRQPGYIARVKSMISELTQYDVSQEQMEEMLSFSEDKPQLYYKLRDVQVLYRAFRDKLREKYITAEEVLSVLCQVVDQSELLKDSVLLLDEFTGFTPIQQRLVFELLKCCRRVSIALTIDCLLYTSRCV